MGLDITPYGNTELVEVLLDDEPVLATTGIVRVDQVEDALVHGGLDTPVGESGERRTRA